MPPSEWPEETVGLEHCPVEQVRIATTIRHGIYRGILIHQWDDGQTCEEWCIMAVEGGIEGLNIDFGGQTKHLDCSAEDISFATETTTCKKAIISPFVAIDAAWDSPREDVVYKVTEIPR